MASPSDTPKDPSESAQSPFRYCMHKKTDLSMKGGFSISLYSGAGVLLKGEKLKGGAGGNIGKRGAVTNWTSQSRRRKRLFDLTHIIPDTHKEYSATLTIPAENLQGKDIKKLWNHFTVSCNRKGYIFSWRREVQERGQVHYHLWLGLPVEGGARLTSGGSPQGGKICDGARSPLERLEQDFKDTWLNCLSCLGNRTFNEYFPLPRKKHEPNIPLDDLIHQDKFRPFKAPFLAKTTFFRVFRWKSADWIELEYMGGKRNYMLLNASKMSLSSSGDILYDLQFRFTLNAEGRFCLDLVSSAPTKDKSFSGLFLNTFPDLSKWPGVDLHCVDLRPLGGVDMVSDRAKQKRYMSDHDSKMKQGQLSGAGRHWGVVNKRLFLSTPPMDFQLTDPEWGQFLRLLSRLRSPAIYCPKAPFSRKLIRRKLSRCGNVIAFGNTLTHERLLQFVKNNHSKGVQS